MEFWASPTHPFCTRILSAVMIWTVLMGGKEMRVVFLALTLMSAGCLDPGRVHRSVASASAAIHVETVARGTQS